MPPHVIMDDGGHLCEGLLTIQSAREEQNKPTLLHGPALPPDHFEKIYIMQMQEKDQEKIKAVGKKNNQLMPTRHSEEGSGGRSESQSWN